MRPRAVIAEDEHVLRTQLVELLHAAWPELEIAAVAEDGAQAIAALEAHKPDVLFLDIHMPEASGIDVAQRASGRCHVVFVTAYDQHAVTAFEQGAVDYVMKPLTGARIATAVARMKERMRSAPASLEGLLAALGSAPRGYGYLRWINVSRGDDVQLVTTDEVLYFQSDTKYTRVVSRQCEGLIRKSIRDLMEELDPDTFWQVHRSTIVNMNAIAGVSRDLAGHVILRLKERRETVQVSQTYAHRFRQM
ncbi:MAG: LytR/AlgR family response regulator transcription factor [Usitatibacter sp.]